MGSRALLLVKGVSSSPVPKNQLFCNFNCKSNFPRPNNNWVRTNCSTTQSSGPSLEPPDLPRLAQTARISLTPHEVEEFAPKIGLVIDWFGQLQDVDLQSVEPSIRADTEGDSFRADIPETFENREAMIAAVPNYEEPYIKVPKVLNKE
ncbi:unnamed protein product [Prunus armeniaca]|uniref:Glutamyl-tRNA(Gln) amidotransferase subunit C, chloroplastic/mitochondrial n=1 Tax=Prunus armeniaca TaxID=36596 RepID=A0A6J5W699_PRUAR|nr:unnamed protein product [Prunus armeniaca]